MTINDYLPLILLYPQIHYKFKFFPFSIYYKKEPEIIIDLPYKIISGKKMPVFLIIKDADKFPIEIIDLEFTFTYPNKKVFKTINKESFFCNSSIFSKPFFFELSDQVGFTTLECKIKANVNGKIKYYINDNFKYKNDKKIRFFLNDNETMFENSYQGDIHYHSSFTSDQVEFGAPLDPTRKAAEALNMQFIFISDHSYDLDDYTDNFLKNDPNYPIFNMMKNDCKKHSDNNFLFINSEEITIKNEQGRNIHAIIGGEEDFFEGYGDSAENWFHRESEYSVNEISQKISKNSLFFAAHPFVPVPFLEYLLIKRGKWLKKDIYNNRIDLLQICNGKYDAGFYEGKKKWIKMLLDNKKVFIGAGNDAHGNFSCFRQIELPMFKLARYEKQLFGKFRTVLNNFGKPLNKKELFSHLKKGNYYITNGPHIEFFIANFETKIFPGDFLSDFSNKITVICKIKSSIFSGNIRNAKFYVGLNDKEILLKSIDVKNIYNDEINFDLNYNKSMKYIRAKIETQYNAEIKIAFSNPIFFYK